MKDIIGQVIWDYFHHYEQPPLWVCYEDGSREEMPPEVYFRSAGDMPQLELIAIRQCRGRVLEIGAGAGSHALLLQEKGISVTALDISPKAATVMKLRGVQHVICTDVFTYEGGPYDTLLLLMNGIGLTGSLKGLHRFLQQARTWLSPGGQLLFDSSDVSYLYKGTPPLDPYYGMIPYYYAYKKRRTDRGTWLYIDPRTLATVALAEGWDTRILYDDGDDQYLAQLTMRQ